MHDIFIINYNSINKNLLDRFPHAQIVKYNSDKITQFKQIAIKSVTKFVWIISGNCDYSTFDFDYTPPWHQETQLHVWPNKNQTFGGDTVLLNASEYLKQCDMLDAIQNYQNICWKTQHIEQTAKLDIFTWHQNSMSPATHNGLRYVGSPLDMMNKTVRRATTANIWIVNGNCDYSNFDFDWRPDWNVEKFLHVWPTENQTGGGDTYYVNVEEFKKQYENIDHLEHYNVISWHKQSISQLVKPEIFIWDHGNNFENLKSAYPDAKVLRYIGSPLDMMNKTARRATTSNIWVISSDCDYSDFDFNWRPGWAKQNYLHVWPTENQILGGDTYYVNIAEFNRQAVELERLEDYDVVDWHEQSIPQLVKPEIFIWDHGNGDQVKLKYPTATVLRHIGSPLDMMNKTVRRATTANIWVISSDCNYDNFDFNWRPSWAKQNYLHVWPTENQTGGGDTYYVNIAEFNRQAVELERLEDYDVVDWHEQSIPQLVKPEIFIWDHGNNFENLKLAHPDAKTLRYIGSPLDMMNKTVRRATTANIWVISSDCDYDNFDFNWRPSWAKQNYLHVWPTENQVLGGDTYYVNIAEFNRQLIAMEQIEDYDVVNWHEQSIPQLVKPEVFIWDHGNNFENLKLAYPHAKTLRYIGSPLDMMNKTARHATTANIWVISSNCNYDNFDFNWRPGWAKQNYLHVWPTENQIGGGDTYYVNIAEFNRQSIAMEQIEDYDVVDWHEQSISQLVKPEIFIWDHGIGDQVKLKYPHAKVLRYIGSPLDMMNKTARHSTTANIWVISSDCNYDNFDFNWRPGWAKQNYLHVWPTENQIGGGDTYYVNVAEFNRQAIELERLEDYDVVDWHEQSIPQLVKPEVFIWDHGNGDQVKLKYPTATVLRHIGSPLDMMNKTARRATTANIWVISSDCDYDNFDFNWRPSWAKQNYLHVWPTENQIGGGDTYYVNIAEFNRQAIELERLENYDVVNWHEQSIPQLVKPEIFIWDHGNNFENLKSAYPDAKTLRYIGSPLDMMNKTARRATTANIWVISSDCNYDNFDFEWRPGWAKQNYLHVWPTENQIGGGDTYYVNVAEFNRQAIELERLEDYDVVDWHEQSIPQLVKPEIFIWDHGNGDQVKLKYPHAKVLRYIGSPLDMMNKTVRRATTSNIWVISSDCNYDNFDFNWRPGWAKQNYLHVWPTENQIGGGDTYYVNVAEFNRQSIAMEQIEDYNVVDWHEQSIPQLVGLEIFIWDHGNGDQVKLKYPTATMLRYVGSPLDMMNKTVRRATTANIWVISSDCDYDNFDFNWRPSWAKQNYLHVWPTENQTGGGDTYYVNVAEFNRQAVELERLEDYNVIDWHEQSIPQLVKPEIVVWDNGNNQASINRIKKKFKQVTVLRQIGSRYDMMSRTVRHLKSNFAWIISNKCNYDEFDFTWRPGWATEKHIHVWPTENQIRGGDTYYVNIAEFKQQQLEINQLEQYNAITWHEESVSVETDVNMIIWAFGGNDINLDLLKNRYPHARVLRYIGTHLEMVKKSIKYVDTEYFWILSDCCDYTNFTTNWRPDWENENSIHCWPSGEQKFGDTFYIPKSKLLEEIERLEKLEYYSSIIWHKIGYPRLPWPTNYVEKGDIYSAVKEHNFKSLYEYFIAPGSTIGSTVDPSLWENRSLIAYNRNGHVSLCPRDAIGQISTRLLDYPYIQYHNCENSSQKAQDIVFISYDEKNADLNYEKLKNRFSNAKRVHGIRGNVLAYKEAAKLSSTPWYYAVFPKTEIDTDFNFDHHPNYLETPGHYIFYAHNRVTDYKYGHGGVKLYHVKTTIEIKEWGYDFTMSSPVITIPVNSCYIEPATAYEAWRTSFREVLKLKNDTTIESQYRLERWLTVGNGEFGEYSKKGAQAALEYTGSLDLANSWEWLKEQFDSFVN